MLNAMAKSLGGYTPEQLILKITLAGSEPATWRRVEIHSGLTLHDLHFVLQSVFDLAKTQGRLQARLQTPPQAEEEESGVSAGCHPLALKITPSCATTNARAKAQAPVARRDHAPRRA